MNLLVIDDNPQITILLSRILKNKGHHVVSSNFFDDGMIALEKESFDAIIVDAPLPGYEKLNVLTELENRKILSSKKVILFTGLEIPNSVVVDLKMKGLYSYLKKTIGGGKINFRTFFYTYN